MQAHQEVIAVANRGDEQAGRRYGEPLHDAQAVRSANMKQLAKQIITDESGQDLIEYVLVAAIISLSAILAVHSLANAIGNGFNSVSNSFNNDV
jgi:pilus assembly protein Flp/PilA